MTTMLHFLSFNGIEQNIYSTSKIASSKHAVCAVENVKTL